jgi:hypothetical protein
MEQSMVWFKTGRFYVAKGARAQYLIEQAGGLWRLHIKQGEDGPTLHATGDKVGALQDKAARYDDQAQRA